MRELAEIVERLFEQAGENAGHELRAEPFVRRIADLRGLDARLDALAEEEGRRLGAALERFEAVSVSPHAPARGGARSAGGTHVAWLLDESRVVRGGEEPEELSSANPGTRHLRMLHAVYAAPIH
jgi:hypothetical protein